MCVCVFVCVSWGCFRVKATDASFAGFLFPGFQSLCVGFYFKVQRSSVLQQERGGQAARASFSDSSPRDTEWKCEAPPTALSRAHFPSPAERKAVIPTSIKGNPHAELTPLKQVWDRCRHPGSRHAPAPCPQMAVTMTMVCGLWLLHPAVPH